MRTWTGIAGLFFGASLAVYSGPANRLFAAVTVGREGAAKNDVSLINGASSTAAATSDGTTPALNSTQSSAAAAAAAAANSVDPFAINPGGTPLSASTPTSSDTTSSTPGAQSPTVVPLGDSTPTTNPSATPMSDAGQSVTATQVNVNDSGSVEIHVNDANLLEVLRMLSLQSQKNIIASKDVTGTVTANLYNVTVREALDAILHANGYAYRERGNFIYVYTTKELIEMDKQARELKTQVFHLYYTPAANAVNMIKPVLSPEAQVAFTAAPTAGIDQTGTKETGGNSHSGDDTIVVTDYGDNLDKVKKILKDIDRRPQQILIEATILSATLSDDNALGVDFSVMGGVKFDQVLAPPSQTITDAAAGNLTNAAGNGKASYGIGQTDFTRQLPPGGLRVGYLTNNISFFVQALESVTNTTVLANPKVLALDKQKGEVIIGRKDGYLTSTVTETAKVETVEFLDTGTRLIFRPYIGDDGYVRMEIHPEDSSGGLTSANLPFKVTTEVTSNVMVKDGHTIVIGGLFRDASDTSRGQVPGFGNIPVLGVLFRQQRDRTQREEVIILLTPHIIKDESAYSELSEEEKNRAEEYRVGVRKGMMWFGRERLAETAYQNAQAALREPNANKDLAMWHLNNATNLNPQFIEAIELKEKLSGQHVTSVDNSSIRTFVTRSMMADHGALETAPPATDITSKPVAPTSQMELEPTSQPAAMPIMDGPTTQPTTQPIELVEGPASTQPTTQPFAVDLPATQPTSQPSLAENDPTSTVTPIADETPADKPAQADESGEDLVNAARALAEAAGHMSSAAEDLAHFAEKQPQGKQSAMPTTRRTNKSNAGTVTVVPLDDGGN